MSAPAPSREASLDRPTAQPIPGLVWAFRFHADGTAEELAVDRPIEKHDLRPERRAGDGIGGIAEHDDRRFANARKAERAQAAVQHEARVHDDEVKRL